MNTRTLGKTNYQVSEIGLGTWQLGESFGPVSDEQAATILKTARSLDVNFWDTADVYGGGSSERRIAAFSDKKGVRVATKLGRNGEIFPNRSGFTRRAIKESLAGSLKRLEVESLDLAQLHTLPIEVLRDGEIFNVMDDLRDEGLMRFYGASVESVEEGLLAMRHEGIATLQVIFNLLRQDYAWRLLPEAKKNNVGVIVRLPLASGLLSGKWKKGQAFAATDHRSFNANGEKFNVGETFSGLPLDTGVELVDELKQLAPKGLPLSRFALRWLLDQPEVSTIIAGVTRPDQLEANVAAARVDPLEPELHEELRDWYERRVRGNIRGKI